MYGISTWCSNIHAFEWIDSLGYECRVLVILEKYGTRERVMCLGKKARSIVETIINRH